MLFSSYSYITYNTLKLKFDFAVILRSTHQVLQHFATLGVLNASLWLWRDDVRRENNKHLLDFQQAS